VYKYFSGAGNVFLNTSQASPAPERCHIHVSYTSPAPDKYLYALFRRRRSAYIHLFGAGEAGEAGEVFIYTLRLAAQKTDFLPINFGALIRY